MKKLKKWICILALTLAPFLVFAQDPPKYEPEMSPYPTVTDPLHYWIDEDGTGYFMMTGGVIGEFRYFAHAVHFFERYDVDHIVIYLNSPGGSLFEGLGFAQIMLEQQLEGKVVEVRCYGLAASAATLILAMGTPGYRYIAEGSFIMVHELWVAKFFQIQSVSQIEKVAQVMRKLQNGMVDFLCKRLKISPETLIQRCKEETWITAEEAIKWGFADHIIKGGGQ